MPGRSGTAAVDGFRQWFTSQGLATLAASFKTANGRTQGTGAMGDRAEAPGRVIRSTHQRLCEGFGLLALVSDTLSHVAIAATRP